MEKIIVSQENKIWKDSSDRIIKTRPFLEETVTNGKIAEYISGNYENIDGYARQWYDSIGTNHLIQNTVAYRFYISTVNGFPILYGENEIGATKISYFDFPIFKNYKSATVVFYKKNSASQWNITDNGGTFINGAGIYTDCIIYKSNTSIEGTQNSNVYVNSIINNNYFPPIGSLKVIHFNLGDNTFIAKSIGRNASFYQTYGSSFHIILYDRNLMPQEITYNTNALATRYNIPL